ncbi:hypothetical protein SD77_3935 [Bacillus badius]|uniref:Secreted protein n=1 Tax=Bacillus badius TaxID=1455 RepID=A0ABR5AUG3_BACBA|nr:hypothetical protein SD78_0914 [Bacillus badius]KIL78255.1 hypothetical protein SD77_3935 [Bacillus badius]
MNAPGLFFSFHSLLAFAESVPKSYLLHEWVVQKENQRHCCKALQNWRRKGD